jgi:hypothetical protein
MPLDPQTQRRFRTGSTTLPARSQRLIDSPQQRLVSGVRKMQAEMRKNLDPGIAQSDRDTLNAIYAELDHEGFNMAADQLERPN